MGTYTDLVKKYFTFSSSEIQGIIAGTVLLGFMFSFREWGVQVFDVASGVRNLISSILVVALVFLVYTSSQKLFALAKGYTAEFKTWIYGLLFGLVITFVTRGYIVAVLSGGVFIYHMAGQHLGKYQYGLRVKDIGQVALIGPVSVLILAIIFKLINLALNIPLAQKVVAVGLWFAVFSMLPIPSLDGANVFFFSRTMWVLSFVAISVAAFLIYFFNTILVSLIAALIVGILAAILWVAYVEK